MDQAKSFISDVKDHVDELTDYQEWVPKVMNSDKPVILDCYAEYVPESFFIPNNIFI
jgi:hypothetical protein